MFFLLIILTLLAISQINTAEYTVGDLKNADYSATSVTWRMQQMMQKVVEFTAMKWF